MQPVFDFYDIGLAVLDKSGEFFVDWAVFYAAINPFELNQIQRENNLCKFPANEPLFKYAFARAVHNRNPRNNRPSIKINCAALPREPVESELFGHEKGAFTGAFEKRLDKFELADQGTIFLDEIGDLPLEMQVKLLRVLQEREIERLGGKGIVELDLRVVAATKLNLAREVQAGSFRADLYYRLCTVELFLCRRFVSAKTTSDR